MAIITDAVPILFPVLYFLARDFWGRTQRASYVTTIGYIFLIIWSLITYVNEYREGDYGNVLIITVVLIFTLYLLTFRRNLLLYGYVPLTISIMVLIYFLLKIVDDLTHMLTYTTAVLTYKMLKLTLGETIGFKVHNSEIFIEGIRNSYYFTFACTGFQSIAIITAPMIATQDKSCIRNATYVAALIYILNVIRGFLIVFFVERLEWDYYIVHTVIMKIFSIIALIAIFYYVLVTCKALAMEFTRISRIIFRS
ncbi:MAG TPA: hypothetical protein ENK81_03485 [Euryarchaeota archaeon]|nr:hypothetical protein [Euryarchaeota archaeon]